MNFRENVVETAVISDDESDMFADLLPQVGGVSATRLVSVVDEAKLTQEFIPVIEPIEEQITRKKLNEQRLFPEGEIGGKSVLRIEEKAAKRIKKANEVNFVDFVEIQYMSPNSEELLSDGLVRVSQDIWLVSRFAGKVLLLETRTREKLYKLPEDPDRDDASLIEVKDGEVKIDIERFSLPKYYIVEDVDMLEIGNFVKALETDQNVKRKGTEQ